MIEEHTLKVLEFDKIITKLQEQAACALGREVAGLTYPAMILDVARQRQRETSEAGEVLRIEGNIPLGGIEDIRGAVQRAAVEALLQPSDLLSISHTLQSTRRLRDFFCKLRERYPILGDYASDMESFGSLIDVIGTSISSGGEVLDSASPALARVRSELRSAQSRLMEKLNSFLQSSSYRTAIQEPIITLRDDRYCIPVKSEHRGQFPGIVHDASASGATLFIEPASVVDLGNKRKELSIKERDEVEKVLAKLTAAVAEVSEKILASLTVVGIIDCITARAKLSRLQDAVEPVLNDKGIISLRGARHPLLSGEVVPIDIYLGTMFNALLITGPNTGGKTVCLKTTGLMSIMAASGLHIPAESGSEVAVFDAIYADIGDEQSIEQSLSTFSSHLRNIIRITNNATENSLVLLDELGAGTDPGEGAALAKAIIDHLLMRGAKIIATTHYGELKEYAYMQNGIENASVDFDIETLRPTYHLMIGIPGSSNAFAIASRLGLDEKIITAARTSMDEHAETSEELIRKIEESLADAAEQKRAAEKHSRAVEGLRRKYEEQLGGIENVKSKVEKKVKDRAEATIEDYSKRLDNVLEQLAAQKRDSKRAQDLKKKAEKLIERIDEEVVKPVELKVQKEEKLSSDTALVPGLRVRIAGVDQDGTIAEPPQAGKVVVMVGAMRVTVPISSLRTAKHSEPERPKETRYSAAAISFEKAKSFNPEVHLRGMRVEPALIELDKYIDDAIASGADQVRIVHGKGTGQMRIAVTQYLRNHPGIASYRLGEQEEGGSGVTIAVIKK